MKAKTFFDDEGTVEVEILSAPSSTGLCKVQLGDRVLVRHKDRLTPIDDEAKQLLRSNS